MGAFGAGLLAPGDEDALGLEIFECVGRRGQREAAVQRDILLVQNLKLWQARPPKPREVPEEVPDSPQPDPPPFVAADEREVGEASDPAATGT